MCVWVPLGYVPNGDKCIEAIPNCLDEVFYDTSTGLIMHDYLVDINTGSTPTVKRKCYLCDLAFN